MQRITRLLENDTYYVVDETQIQHDAKGYCGEAVTRLAHFENIYDHMLASQGQIIKEMEKLKAEGKTHSVKFKQLLANKITNNDIIALFETYGPLKKSA
jgi:predicted thioesterase